MDQLMQSARNPVTLTIVKAQSEIKWTILIRESCEPPESQDPRVDCLIIQVTRAGNGFMCTSQQNTVNWSALVELTRCSPGYVEICVVPPHEGYPITTALDIAMRTWQQQHWVKTFLEYLAVRGWLTKERIPGLVMMLE
ncbi:hypothetical protein BJX99DRAFT_252802 [Aspergillus californicus]